MGRAFLRRVVFGSTTALGGCSLLLGDGLTSPDEPAVDAAVDTTTEAGADGIVANDAGKDTFVPPPDGACPSIDTSLAAWFPFEEDDSAIVRDCSGHGLDGKLVLEGNFQRVPGRTSGKAIDTGGDRGCFDLGGAAALAFVGSDFTVTAWIKPRTYSYVDPNAEAGSDPKPRWFVNRFASDNGGWGVGTDDSDTETGFVEIKSFRAGGSFEEAEGALPKGAWVHVAGVFTPALLTLYIDGKLSAEKILVLPTSVDPKAHAWIGCRGGDEPSFDGALDDLRIYGRTLSAEEIAALSK